MKSKLTTWLVLGCATVLLSGCYTALKAPFSGDLTEKPRASKAQQEWQDDNQPRLGRFARDDEWETDSGYGYGYPVFGYGYDSQYGSYGMGMPYGGSYGYSPYNYGYGGYGPYGYGYDPYYQGGQGIYIPPGYELITTRELEELKAQGKPASNPNAPVIDPEAAKRAEAKKQREIWQRRTSPQDRPAPVTTPRPVAAPDTGKEGSNAPKPAAPAKQSGAPKKVRR